MYSTTQTNSTLFSVLPSDLITLVLSYYKLAKKDIVKHLIKSSQQDPSSNSSTYILKLLFGYSRDDPSRTPFQLYNILSFGMNKKLFCIPDVQQGRVEFIKPILNLLENITIKRVNITSDHLAALSSNTNLHHLRIVFGGGITLPVAQSLAQCVNLQSLDLSRIYSHELDMLFRFMPQLVTLKVSLFTPPDTPDFNPINFSSFQYASFLRILHISCNFKLHRNMIPSKLVNMHYLMQNQLKELHFSMYMDASSLSCLYLNTTIESLTLVDCMAVGDLGAQHIAKNSSLKYVKLHNCNVNNKGASSLMGNELISNSLMKISLPKNRFLAKSLELVHASANLVAINVEDCRIGDAGATLLAQNKNLKRIVASNCQISAIGAAALLIMCNQVEALYLSHNLIHDSDFYMQLKAIEMNYDQSSSKLEYLKIDHNNLGPLSAKWISNNLPNLEKLNISYNNIEGGAFFLLSNKKNPQFTSFNLENCGVIDEYLYGLEKNQSVSWLCLSNNKITDQGAKFLGSQTQIKRLLISQNQLTSIGLDEIIKNNSLVLLWIEGCKDVDIDSVIERLPESVSSFRASGKSYDK